MTTSKMKHKHQRSHQLKKNRARRSQTLFDNLSRHKSILNYFPLNQTYRSDKKLKPIMEFMYRLTKNKNKYRGNRPGSCNFLPIKLSMSQKS